VGPRLPALRAPYPPRAPLILSPTGTTVLACGRVGARACACLRVLPQCAVPACLRLCVKWYGTEQVQYHVGMGPLSRGSGVNATDDKEYDRALGVTYQSFSPLCGPCEGADR